MYLIHKWEFNRPNWAKETIDQDLRENVARDVPLDKKKSPLKFGSRPFQLLNNQPEQQSIKQTEKLSLLKVKLLTSTISKRTSIYPKTVTIGHAQQFHAQYRNIA